MEKTSNRINLMIPLDLAILMDKECEKLSVTPAQFLRGAAYERVKRLEVSNDTERLDVIETDIKELKNLISVVIKLLSK
ncbi:MAG: hypothetical protein LBT69_04490 [Lactobacillales bacterium]|nr:hypothetical protein [Lactobacillales bacterium]